MDIGSQWREIIDSVQEGIIIVDAHGDFIAANHSAQLLTGYSEDELKGQSCRILNCTGCKIIGKGPGKLWCGLFSAGRVRDKKCVITSASNRTIPIVKTARVLYGKDAQILGAVETLLEKSSFFRVSRSYLVNLRYLSRVDRKSSQCFLEAGETSCAIKIPPQKVRLLESSFH